MGKKLRINSKQWLTSAPSTVCGAGNDPFVVGRLEADDVIHAWEFGQVVVALQREAPAQAFYNELHPLITHNVRNPIMQLVADFLESRRRPERPAWLRYMSGLDS